MGNIVAIVGRPNVGKSTLFNRLTKSRRAIVNDEAGTTRDRQYGKSEWEGREFSVIDTGGWVVNSSDVFEDEIKRHVVLAIEEADVILFMVDIQNGITDYDLEILLLIDNYPRNTSFCKSTSTTIMPIQPINQIRSRANIITITFL